MKRFAAHYFYSDEHTIIPKAVIELNDDNVVIALFPLTQNSETAHTLFYNGVLFSSHLSTTEIFDELISSQQKDIVDLWQVVAKVAEKVEIGNKVCLILMEGVDLLNKQITLSVQLKVLS
jgi:hypothetical protein